MKKIVKPLSVILALIGIFAFTCCGFYVSAQETYPMYTYWTGADGSLVAKPIKDHYRVSNVIDSQSLGVSSLGRIIDICTDKLGNTYVLDSDRSTVYVLDERFNLVQTITELYHNGTILTFNMAQGIYVDNEGMRYIADTENARVIRFDSALEIDYIFELPDSPSIPDEFVYRPMKVSVDDDGYVYVLSDGSFYGAILYSPEKEFLGFFGSNNVAVGLGDIFDSIIDRFTMTNEKRANTASKLPYQIADVYVDSENFIYTATGAGTNKGQIKRFSRGGENLLDSQVTFGDSERIVVKIGTTYQRRDQDILGVAVDNDNIVYTLDSTYGRVFIYDSECNMICAFGAGLGEGTQKGTFKNACAIDVKNNGKQILVADSLKNNVTVFQITPYGELVKSGCVATSSGDYDSAEKIWKQVINLDKNCQLAFSGIASARFVKKDYTAAAEYAKIGMNKNIYSEAMGKIRTTYLKDNFYIITLILVLVIAATVMVYRVLKAKALLKVNNIKFKVFCACFAHPFDSFDSIKYKKSGSTVIALILTALFYVSSVLSKTACGFAFSTYNIKEFNSIFILVRTVGIVILWTVANWAIAQLVSGIATFKETFIAISYSLMPVIVGNLIYTVLSHFISLSSGVFLEIVSAVALLYTLFMLAVSTMKINDYSFGKFVITAILTVAIMLLAVFLIFVLVILAQQFFGFLTTLVTEIVYY